MNQQQILDKYKAQKQTAKLKETTFQQQLRASFTALGDTTCGCNTVIYKIPGGTMSRGWPDLMIMGGAIPERETIFIETKCLPYPKRHISLLRTLTDNQRATIDKIALSGGNVWVVVALGKSNAVCISGRHLNDMGGQLWHPESIDLNNVIVKIYRDKVDGKLQWCGLNQLI